MPIIEIRDLFSLFNPGDNTVLSIGDSIIVRRTDTLTGDDLKEALMRQARNSDFLPRDERPGDRFFSPFNPGDNTVSSIGDSIIVRRTDTLTGDDLIEALMRQARNSDFLPRDERPVRSAIEIIGELTMGPSSDNPRDGVTSDNDSLIGESSYSDATVFESHIAGILIRDKFPGRPVLTTGYGSDYIYGNGAWRAGDPFSPFEVVGILFEGSKPACAFINTGDGDDIVTGEALGRGNSLIAGIATSPSLLRRDRGAYGIIDTGKGSDKVTGLAVNTEAQGPTFGITNVHISTGDGKDEVVAKATVIGGRRANGFGSDVFVDLGDGGDLLRGFGGLTADGGKGWDSWDLIGYKVTEFKIIKTNQREREATFAGPGNVTATMRGFDVFFFSDGQFTYDTLPSALVM